MLSRRDRGTAWAATAGVPPVPAPPGHDEGAGDESGHRDLGAAGRRADRTLAIGGMTCASCANPDRAQAQQARRRHARPSTTPPRRPRSPTRATVTLEDLVAQVEAAGYTARAPAPAQGARRRGWTLAPEADAEGGRIARCATGRSRPRCSPSR
ncbi:hypothetical protein ACU686_22280 [Yinghuangia aomiensis]